MPKSRTFKFTQVAIDKLKPPATGRLDYSNAAIPGMQLRVSASGKKIYRVKTRINGAQQPMTIGSTAVLSLAEANKRAKEFLSQAAAGVNPVEERRRKEAEAAGAETVVRLIERYFLIAARRLRPGYFKEMQRVLRRDVLPKLGAIPIDKLTRRQIRNVIGEICARGFEPHAAHVLRYLQAFLSWCVREDIIATSPAAGIPDPDTRRREDRERDRWLSDDEITLFWFACNKVGTVFGPFFQLLLLFGCRRTELAEATWAEFDLVARTWLLPGRRSKNGNALLTHISEPAAVILAAQPRPSDPTQYLFSTNGRTPIAGFGIAMARIIAEMSARAGREIVHFTPHDLRRSLATGMAELGVSEHIVDRILNHSGGRISGVARIYNRSEYIKERQAALDLWGAHIMELVRPKAVEVADSLA